MRVRDLELRFGERTYVMGIVNVTPDSFSGDGLLAGRSARRGRRGARPCAWSPKGPTSSTSVANRRAPATIRVSAGEELDRVVAVVSGHPWPPAGRAHQHRHQQAGGGRAPPSAAGADIINDVAGVTAGAALAPVAAAHGAPYIVMHSRARPEYDDVVAEVVADLGRALAQARGAAAATRPALIVDPGIGFGKTAEQNLALLAGLAALRSLGRPVLLGTAASRPSARSSICPSRSGSRARWPRPRWASPPVSTSCASTMSPPTSARRA